uniref:Pentatricopeptide repeat-containing protein n=1 Tax=Rhizophora mucronata TaxID=61149 RepID=A0A2P2JSB7_RHIMU
MSPFLPNPVSSALQKGSSTANPNLINSLKVSQALSIFLLLHNRVINRLIQIELGKTPCLPNFTTKSQISSSVTLLPKRCVFENQ